MMAAGPIVSDMSQAWPTVTKRPAAAVNRFRCGGALMLHGMKAMSGEGVLVKLVASSISAAVLATALAVSAPASAAGIGDYISEVKGGLFDHDALRDQKSKQKEMDTLDINGEILSKPIRFADSNIPVLKSIYQPRVHLGFTANTAGYTSAGYTGVTWDFNLGSNIFFALSFGLTVHDGQLHTKKSASGASIGDGRPALGSTVLFREGGDIGYKFDQHNSASIFFGHMSNAGWFAKENAGMNFLGLRYGYSFN
jgi:lipid A 3-O-deacylase